MPKSYDDFFNALGQRESSGSYKTESCSGYLGKYQFSELAMRDIGWFKADGTSANDWKAGYWTGPSNIRSKADFLSNPAAQEAAIRLYMDKQHTYLREVLQFDGQTLNGVHITMSGMLAGAHLVGYRALADFLLAGAVGAAPKDGNGTLVTEYLSKFGDYTTPFDFDHSKNETLKGGGGDDVLFGGGGRFTFVANGAPALPKPGAVISIIPWIPGGHVGIICNHDVADEQDGAVNIKIVEQNMPIDTWKEITFTKRNNLWYGAMLNRSVYRDCVGWANPTG